MNQSRRDFFKQVLGFAALTLWTLKARAAETMKFVVPGQGMAASVNYSEDKKKVKKDLQTDRQGVKFANQKCSVCALYTKVDEKAGKCALFPNEYVKANAWCASWSKKA
jgi:hypothetical protein